MGVGEGGRHLGFGLGGRVGVGDVDRPVGARMGFGVCVWERKKEEEGLGGVDMKVCVGVAYRGLSAWRVIDM